MLNYTKISKNPSQFLSLTSLAPDEFAKLLSFFTEVWETNMRYYTFDGKLRQRAYSEKSTAKLPLIGDKLFFILYYLKTNPLQETLAANFGMTQPQSNRFIQLYLPVLEKALKCQQVLPCQTVSALTKYLEDHQINLVYQDGTERPVERSTDYDTQKEYYSGKKRCHSIKNNVITDDKGEVLFISDTYEGKTHDKRISDELELSLPDGTIICQDTGFQGYKPDGTNIEVMMPMKKPRGREFTDEQKEHNRQISSVRVRVEHSIGGVKRLRILKEKIRHKKEGLRDQLFLIGCGLHNFRLKFRPWNYQNPQT